MNNIMQNVYLYTRYERFWHWLQMVLIIQLLITGFEIHGSYVLFGFEEAVKIHNTQGITWFISFCFFVFWVFPIRFQNEKMPSIILFSALYITLYRYYYCQFR